MNDFYQIRPIAHIETDFQERFGIPRQSGLIPGLTGRIVFEEEFRNIDAVKGIEGFSYLWLIWGFSETRIDMQADPVKWSPTVAPPRLGGKVRIGVFASRSPYRPNSMGLSSVRLLSVDKSCAEAPVLYVEGADLLSGTPVFDIKPYVPYADSHPEAESGFAVSRKAFLRVEFPGELLSLIPEEKQDPLLQVLQQDPRGAYEKQPDYTYGLCFAGYDIRFTVDGDVLRVFEVLRRTAPEDGFRKIK